MKTRKRDEWDNYELFVISRIQDMQGRALLANDMKLHAWVTVVYDDGYESLERIRVKSSQAYLIVDDRFIYVQSYCTIIGAYDSNTGRYCSMGAYSMTTYQHERKALALIEKMGFNISRKINLWVVDDFAS